VDLRFGLSGGRNFLHDLNRLCKWRFSSRKRGDQKKMTVAYETKGFFESLYIRIGREGKIPWVVFLISELKGTEKKLVKKNSAERRVKIFYRRITGFNASKRTGETAQAGESQEGRDSGVQLKKKFSEASGTIKKRRRGLVPENFRRGGDQRERCYEKGLPTKTRRQLKTFQ